MSYTYGSNIGYESSGGSYAGAGQTLGLTPLPLEFSRRLQMPNARPVFLATITVGVALDAWRPYIPVPGVSTTAQLPASWFHQITGVHSDAGESLTEDIFPLATPGTWLRGESRQIFVRPADEPGAAWTYAIYNHTYTAKVALRFSNLPKQLRDFHWPARLLEVPALSYRIEEKFGGVGQLGGGKLRLNNGDGWFDRTPEFIWDGGQVVLEMGVDLPAGAAMTGDLYQRLGTWRVESSELGERDVVLVLREMKTRLDQEIPFERLNREQFPNLENKDLEKPIPRAYGKIFGAEPIVVDRGARRFKVAGHRIRSFDAVRTKRNIDEVQPIALSAFTLDAGAVNRYRHNAPKDVVNVTFDGADLLAVNSVETVEATAGSWHHQTPDLFVRPPSGQTIASGSYVARQKEVLSVWIETAFASIDLVNAEFNLGQDWDRAADVSVDFSGRVNPDLSLMTNAADIMADLIDYVGEIALDAESFARAKASLYVGTDAYGAPVDRLSAGLHVDEIRNALEIVSELNAIAGSFAFVDFAGRWRFAVFEAQQGAALGRRPASGLRRFSEKDIVPGTFKRILQNKDIFSRIKVFFARRLAEEWAEIHEENRPRERVLHDLAANVVEEREPGLWRREDAANYAQRILTTEAQPLATYKFRVPWTGFFLLPGDQFRLVYPRFDLDDILETIEVKYDLVKGQLDVAAGNRRAWGDTFGWWVGSGAVPADVPAPNVWLRPDALPVGQSELVQWVDASGFSNHAAAFGFNRPTIRANALNGYPVVKFSELAPGSYAGLYLLQYWLGWTEAEIFVVLKADLDPAVDNNKAVLWKTYDTTQRYPDTNGEIVENFFLSFGSPNVNCGNPTKDLSGWRLYNVAANPTDYVVRLDNSTLYSTTAHSFARPDAAQIQHIGGSSHSPIGGWLGEIAELRIFRRVLASTERAAVVQDLSDKYALGIVAAAASPPAWNPAWTDAEVKEARYNGGYWHAADNLADSADLRSLNASRWW